MQKTYKATYLYVIKTSAMFAAMITAFLAFNFGMMMLNVVIPTWVFIVVNIILSLFALLFLFMQLTAKAPVFVFHDTGFKYKRKTIEFSEVANFKKASGGSEPELVFKNGKEYPLELSWFLKKDRKEIEAILEERING
ncbi:hypothetical protein [Pseudofulvibacter geojedonensis]|uniref:Uncharacterized protein n=1 Tax=Pseudofulvibacter geojedonensis TaxID=1123758 RepID=A0ABW3I3A9_9FLAO